MSNVNVTRQGPEVQWDDTDRGDYIRLSQRDIDPPMRSRTNGDVIRSWGLVLGAFGLLLLLVLYGLAGWQCRPEANVFETSLACHASQGLFWLYLTGLVVAPLAGAATMLWGYRRRTLAETERALITRDAWSNPVHADVLRQMGAGWAVYQFNQRQAHEQAVAPYKVLPGGLENLSLHNSVTNRPDVAALPEPATAPYVGPVPAEEWLRWMDEVPHLMLAAESGGGKSVLATVILDRRVRATGDAVAILDPHWSPEVEADEGVTVPKWAGIPPLAKTHRDIRLALKALREEYDRRMEQLRNGEVLEKHFPWLTVIIDEVPEVVKELKRLDAKGEDTWAATAEVLGSGARKVNIRVILLSQSALVEDVGMNSAMRKNFYRVALSHQEAAVLLKGSNQPKGRLAAVEAALAGQDFPAVVVRRGEAYVLDRAGLLAMMPETIDAEAWTPPGGSLDRSFDRPEDAGLLEELLTTSERANERGTVDLTLEFLVQCAKAGLNRDQAFKTARAAGHQFTSSQYEWGAIRTLAGVE